MFTVAECPQSKKFSRRPYQGSNLGSSAPETDALSTGPQGHSSTVSKPNFLDLYTLLWPIHKGKHASGSRVAIAESSYLCEIFFSMLFNASGEDYVWEQSLCHASSYVWHAANTNLDVQQAALQIICRHLEKRLENQAFAEKTEETSFIDQGSTCCLITAILAEVYEHNVQTDPKAQCTTGRRQLAVMSLMPQIRPDGTLTGNL